jgi:nucleoside-triphosphatase
VTEIFLVTGKPGSGKITLLLRVAERLRSIGIRVGGMITRETRVSGVRVGFEILDLASKRRGNLAVKGEGKPRVGKYVVNVGDLEEVGVKAILDALREADVVFIDEVGPMELYSRRFKEAVRQASNSGKPLLATIHYRVRDSLIWELKSNPKARIFEVSPENRDRLVEDLTLEIQRSLK